MSKRISGLKEELFINNRKFIMQEDAEILDSRSEDSVRRHIIMVNRVISDVLDFFYHPVHSIISLHHVIT